MVGGNWLIPLKSSPQEAFIPRQQPIVFSGIPVHAVGMGMKSYSLLLMMIAWLTMGLAPARATDLAATFNMNDLLHTYNMSCAEQAALRHRNILPEHFHGRPQEFLNPSEALVIYSPALTREERQEAEKLYNSIPKYALPIAWRGGAVYVFTRRGIVEAVPALAIERDWFEDFGLYMEVERRMYVPFEKGEGFDWRNGHMTAKRWVRSARDQFRVINHETGHMIDEMLGAYSYGSLEEDGQYRLSNRPDFQAAIRSDLARLASPRRPIPLARIHKLGYYMPYKFNGVRLGIHDPQRARREVFAELWAEVQGYNLNKLYEAYPDSFKVVKNYADFLKKLDADKPACEFN